MSSSNPSRGTGSNPSTSAKGGFVPPSTDDLDAILDQYEFLELIGRGGMGAVYKARQKSLDRLVAIKILPPNLTTDEEEAGFHFAERFQREAKAMAKLSHPHIIGVYDFGQAKDGQYYFVMEYVEGTDLHALIKGGQLTVAHVTGWMSQICDALQYAHGRGVVHRDIKPANIMITREGQVKVADFGLAKLSSGNAAEQTKLTMTNMAMGTPDYVAPEALEIGVEVDHRADLYALGVMLYEMLTGKVPRGAWKSPSAQIEGLDERYDAVIERAMDSDRESRFQQASEISATIYEIATTVAKPARPKLAMGTAPVKSPPATSGPAAKEPTRSVKPSGAKDRTGPQAMSGRSRDRESAPVKKSKSPALLISGLTGGAALVGLGVFFALFKGGSDPVPLPSAMTLTGNGTPELAPQNPPPTTPPPVAKPAPPKVEAPKAEPSPAPPAPATPVGAVMPKGMVAFNGHRYQFFPDILTLPEARTRAEDMGGHLVTINSKEENDWVATQFVSKLPLKQALWLGGTKDGTTGQWRWVTGEPIEFTQWGAGEPNPNPNAGEPALQFSHSEKYGPEWGDIKENGVGAADRRGGYLVEWDSESGPGNPPPPPSEVLTYAGHRYQFHAGTYAWPEAKGKAEALGGHLATPQSKEETEWIIQAFAVPRLQHRQLFWIDGRIDSASSGWKWHDESPAIVTTWGGGRPYYGKPEQKLTYPGYLALRKYNETFGVEDCQESNNSGVEGWPARMIGFLVEWDDNGTKPGATPPAVAETDQADLMTLLDLNRDLAAGKAADWTREASQLIYSSTEPVTSLVAPVSLAGVKGYEMQIVWRRSNISSGDSPALDIDLPMPYGRMKLLSIGQAGNKVNLGGTRLGVFDAAAPKSGMRVTVRVDAYGSVTVTLDNDEIAKSREGTNSDFLPHPALGPGQYPRISLSPGRHEIQSWSLTALDGKIALLAQPSTSPAGTLSATTTAIIPDDPRVAQLDGGFKTRLDTDAENPYQIALAALNQSYAANGIARTRATAQQAGKLDDITALDAEKALVESGAALPATDPDTLPEAIKALRATYRAAHTKLLAERDAKAAPLYDIYLGALDAYIAELTKANAIEQAKAVKAWREAVAALKTSAAAVPVAASAPNIPPAGSAAPTIEPSPTKAGGNVERRAAEFLVAVSGKCQANKGGGANFEIARPDDIPNGRFTITELGIDRLNSSRPPLKDADLLALIGLDALQRVNIRPVGCVLTDAAYAFLAGNRELTWINLESAKEVSDALLEHLADSTKLEHLAVQRATRFTGRGLAGKPFQKTLTFVDFLDSGIDDAGLAAIADCPNLGHVCLTKSVGTDAGFAVLGKLKKLKYLDALDTRIGPQALAALAVLPDLENLNLERTLVGDADIAPLAESKKLRKLNLKGTKATQAGIAALQKALPQCQIEF
jgi:serine/threonine protein kinase